MTPVSANPRESQTEPAPASPARSSRQPAIRVPRSSAGRAVVVHGGARDNYQVALALAQHNLLEVLVTDLFWPSDRPWAQRLASYLPTGLRAMLAGRSSPGLPSARVRNSLAPGFKTLLLDRIRSLSFDVRRRAIRSADASLGRKAGRIAARSGAGLLAYSYFAYDAFRADPRPGILFQVHPHPLTIRRILTEELAAHPDCAGSLLQEWELALPEEDFAHLVEEPRLAARYLCASSFTRGSLIENGAPASAIRVIPYGVDPVRFHPDPSRRSPSNARLQLLFVGRINQRKGIKYLVEALRLLRSDQVHLTICGRVIDGLDLFKPFASQIDVRPSVSATDLVAAYQAADLFVFPSVAEGFGQVLLESLASGLPILSTTHTAAPDLIAPGVEGFVIDPRRPDLLAERIDWAATHRAELAEMGRNARLRAEHFTWQRFRSGIAEAVGEFLPELARLPSSGRRDA